VSGDHAPVAVAHKNTQVDGFEIHYAECGNGPPVLLLHGLGGSWQDWSENRASLSQAYRLLALDLPGFGLSPAPMHPIEYTLAYIARFVCAFADRLDLGRVYLIGNSMGGGTALRFAIDFPERTAGVIVANAVGLGREIGWSLRLLSIPGVAALVLPFVTRRMVQKLWQSLVADPALATDERVEATWQWLQKPATQKYLQGVYVNAAGLRGQRQLLLPELASIRAPALIVWGADDHVLPPSHARTAQRLIPNCSVHILPACGHIPQLEQPSAFNEIALGFLRDAGSELQQESP
jgi:2-hydroxymuconate-semialdehyde hydrolase